MAYLDINFDDGSPNTCSGTLISDSWILTAARCVYDSSYVTVTLGAHNISSANETGRQYFTVTPQDYKIHPNWCSKANLEYDIALLRLPQQANFSGKSSRLEIPTNNIDWKFSTLLQKRCLQLVYLSMVILIRWTIPSSLRVGECTPVLVRISFKIQIAMS